MEWEASSGNGRLAQGMGCCLGKFVGWLGNGRLRLGMGGLSQGMGGFLGE